MNITREEAKNLIPLLQAFVDGKTIQMFYGLNDDGTEYWKDLDTSQVLPIATTTSFLQADVHIRVKPESIVDKGLSGEVIKSDGFGLLKNYNFYNKDRQEK